MAPKQNNLKRVQKNCGLRDMMSRSESKGEGCQGKFTVSSKGHKEINLSLLALGNLKPPFSELCSDIISCHK